MDISYWKEFSVLAETKNYWAAAEKLFVGQSSLSKHIKTMETQLGGELFMRTSRKVELTELGKLMLPYAQQIAQLQTQYETAAFNYLSVGSQPLTIGSIPVIPRYHITDLIVKYQLDFPTVHLQTIEEDTLLLRDDLFNHRCDVIFYRDSNQYLEHDPDRENCMIRLPYCQDKLVAVLPTDHPLAEESSIRLEQLKDECFALIKNGTMPYNLCVRTCRSAGFTPHVLFTSHNLEAIFDMVTRGSCVALLFENHVARPYDALNHLDKQPFAVVPIEPPIYTTIYMAYLKDEPLTPAAAHFVDYCKLAAMDNSKTETPNA